MESFNLNIIPGKDRPVCHASQYDIGRTIHVNLFEGFNVFTLDGTEVISISVRKPDGNVVTESVTNTSDSYVEFVTTEQMTACHGSNLCELKLEKGADVIGTMNFILEVEQDPLDGGVQSDTQIHNLQTQVADLVAIEVADQYDSANVIFDAAPTPGHGNGYAVTSEGVATEISTLNNAIALKQDITDANLQTTDTTVVGAINELLGKLTPVRIQATDFFDPADIASVDTSEFFAYRIGKLVVVERMKLVNVNLVSPTYKIVGIQPDYLPSSTLRFGGQFDGTDTNAPWKMYLNPGYGIGSEKWGSYPAIWAYSFSYVIS